MAFPTTISSVSLPTGNNQVKPILNGSNVYIVLRQSGSASTVSVQKATDPSSSFSEVGTWAGSTTITTISSVQDGNEIVVWINQGGDLDTRRFNMDTDTWGTAADSGTTGNAGSSCGSSLVVRSDGVEVFGCRDTDESIMGSSYRRISYTRNVAGVFTEVAIGDGGSVGYPDVVATIDDADRTYFFYQESAGDEIYMKTLTNADPPVLGSAVRVSDAAARAIAPTASNSAEIKPLFYLSGSVKRVIVSWEHSDGIIYTAKIDDVALGGTPDVPDAASAAAVLTSSNHTVADMAVDGTKVWLIYAKASDSDLYIVSNDNDGGWTGEASLKASITASFVGCQVYTRSGSKVLAYLYVDGGVYKYDEYSLGAASQTANPTPLVIPLSLPTPTVTAGAVTLSPPPLAIPLAFPTPTVVAILSPDPLVIPILFPAPTVSPGAVTLTPTALTIPIAFPAPSITAGAVTLTPDALAIPLAFPAPTIVAIISPSPLVIPLAFPAPIVTAGTVTVSPSTLTIPLLFPTPTLQAGAVTLSPGSVLVEITLPAPVISALHTISPDVLAIPLVFPTPTVTAGAVTISPDALTVPLAFPTPAVTAGAVTLTPSAVTIPLSLPNPALQIGAITATPDALVIPVLLTTPIVTGGGNVMSPNPVTIPLVLPAVTTAAGAVTLFPTPLGIVVAIPAPSGSITGGSGGEASYHFIGVVPWWEMPWFTSAWWRQLP